MRRDKLMTLNLLYALFIGFTLGFFITGYRVGIYKGDGGE